MATASSDDTPPAHQLLQGLASEKVLQRCTKKQLEAICSVHGLDTEGTKSVLVDRIDTLFRQLEALRSLSTATPDDKPGVVTPSSHTMTEDTTVDTVPKSSSSVTSTSTSTADHSNSVEANIEDNSTHLRQRKKQSNRESDQVDHAEQRLPQSSSTQTTCDSHCVASTVPRKPGVVNMRALNEPNPISSFLSHKLQPLIERIKKENLPDIKANVQTQLRKLLPKQYQGSANELWVQLSTIQRDAVTQLQAVMGDQISFFSCEYMTRLFVAIICFLVSGYINAVSASSAGWRTPYIQVLQYPSGEPNGMYSLPDLGLDVVAWVGSRTLPDSWVLDGKVHWPDGPDVFVFAHLFCFLILLFISPQRFKIVRRVLVIYSMLNLLRAFTVIATSLPDPFPGCHEQFLTNSTTGLYKLKPMFPNNLIRGLKTMSGHTTCGDCIFSGHSTLMLLVMQTFVEYFNSVALQGFVTASQAKFVRYFVCCMTVLGLTSVLATGFHYTLDVAIAIFLVLRIWDTYHLHTRTLALREMKSLQQQLPMKVLLWFESTEIVRVERSVFGDCGTPR